MFPGASIASLATLILVTLVTLGGFDVAPQAVDFPGQPAAVDAVDFEAVEADIESFALDLVRDRNAP